MHPVMTEKLAAERIREMVAQGDAARRARGAHRARADRRAQGRRGAAARPAAAWTPKPVISARGADSTGR